MNEKEKREHSVRAAARYLMNYAADGKVHELEKALVWLAQELERASALPKEPECMCGEPDVYDGWAQCEVHG